MIEPSITQHDNAAVVSANHPPEQVQLIENAVISEDFVQENDDEPVNLDALLPLIDDHTTLLILNGPINANGSVPDIDEYTEPLDPNDLAVEEIPDPHV
jgi:hypothetical protein